MEDEVLLALTLLSLVLVPILLVGLLIFMLARSADRARAKELATWAKARNDYRESLAHLARDPGNAELRQRTLQRGRAFSNLTRGQQGVALFDEVALMNDIQAACGGTAVATVAPPASAAALSAPSIEQRLARLEGLRQQGLITDEELRTRRQEILAEL